MRGRARDSAKGARPHVLSRRSFLAGTAAGCAWVALGGDLGVARELPGTLLPPDANGVQLPEGFTSRVVGRGGHEVTGTGHVWHRAADGGAVFPTDDGGWIYVSNSELGVGGGVGALRFDPDGEVADAYPILTGTSINCAGGPTPWGTWLSCEEHERGLVWECDPRGEQEAEPRPALGRFPHEAAAVDPASGIVYLTEDRSDGLLYRFVPDRPGDLTAGRLDAAVVGDGGGVSWRATPAHEGSIPLRRTVDATGFNRGEGAWFADGRLVFATTGDNRIWSLVNDQLHLLHQGGAGSPLQGPDNVTIAPNGDVMAAEDGGNLELVVVTGGGAAPFLRLAGHEGSEITGPAFTPRGDRLYFSSQRGGDGGGVTFEVVGPFHPAPAVTTTTAPATTTTTERSAPVSEAALRPADDGEAPATVAGAGALLAVLAGLGWTIRRRSSVR